MVRIRMVTMTHLGTNFARKPFDIIFYISWIDWEIDDLSFRPNERHDKMQHNIFFVTYPIRLAVMPNIRVRSLAQTDHRMWDKDVRVMFAYSLELCDSGLRIAISNRHGREMTNLCFLIALRSLSARSHGNHTSFCAFCACFVQGIGGGCVCVNVFNLSIFVIYWP